MTNPKVDVVVVGAGLSGLVCARELGRRGLAVRLLEAHGRWGGRLLGHTTRSGLRLDVGGQWVGATQHRLIALLEEFGLRRHPTHYDGEGLFHWDGRRTGPASSRISAPASCSSARASWRCRTPRWTRPWR